MCIYSAAITLTVQVAQAVRVVQVTNVWKSGVNAAVNAAVIAYSPPVIVSGDCDINLC